MIKDLDKYIQEFANETLGESFTFRGGQKDIIYRIIESILTNSKTKYICEAPTGSGKSIIAIICAGVLAKYYNYKSFILASDVGLWNQYADFIDKHPLLGFGKLKGMDNYTCEQNNLSIPNRECKLTYKFVKNVLKNKEDFPCFETCPYMQDILSGIKSDVTLLTYSKFITLKFGTDEYSFKEREVLFCDECHNIPDIVQLHSSSTIRFSNLKNIIKIYSYVSNLYETNMFFEYEITEELKEKFNYLKTKFNSTQSIISHYNDLFSKCINNNNRGIYDLLEELNEFWSSFNVCKDILEYTIKKSFNESKTLSSENKEILSACNKYENAPELSTLSTLLDYADIYGEEFIVKDLDLTDKNDPKMMFRFAKEDNMILRSLFDKTSSAVLLSATVGDIESFKENIGLTNDENVIFERLNSSFDFSKSPIYFINKYKMSFAEKNFSIPKIQEFIYRICKKHSGQRGIIQTASYSLSKQIVDNAPIDLQFRFIIYDSAKSKEEALRLFKKNEDSIIIGPTLNEGIDLPGDLCRFIIISKVPYPNLTDGLVNAKMKLFPKWYTAATSNKIIQGIGRGNRYEDDWCQTYILDACFKDLYNKTWKQWPDYLRKRIIERQ